MERIEMSRHFGTKWFTFYTKVRPWLTCIGTLITLGQFFGEMKLYLQYWWLLLSLILSIAVAVLAIMVAIKSEENYGVFVRFVKKVLLFEVFQLAYQQAAQEYAQTLDIMMAVTVFFVIAGVMLLIWYLPNAKYFTKRIAVVKVEDRVPPASDVQTEENAAEAPAQEIPAPVKKARFCRHCGYKLSSDAIFCTACGKKIEE